MATNNYEGFENVFHIVGGDGRFQWWAWSLASFQLLVMTWNHLGYIFIGAVPNHWCHITDLDSSSWTLEQIKNISIPKIFSGAEWKYDQCQQYDLDFNNLLDKSNGDFETAYDLAHGNQLITQSYSSSENTARKDASHSLKSCKIWTFDQSIYKSTIATEFDLVCGKRYLVATVQASYMVGAMVGNLVSGPLSDKVLGRRKTQLISIVLVIIGGFLTSFSSSYFMFITSRLLVALGAASSMQAAKVWLVEHCDSKSRARFFCMSSMFFGVGYAVMPIYAYFIRTWYYLQFAFTVTTCSLLSFYWLFPESPRWLASQGREEEAVKALENIALFNRVIPIPERADLLKFVRECCPQKSVSNWSVEASCVEMESLNLETTVDVVETKSNPKIKNAKRKQCLDGMLASVKNFAVLLSPELRRTSLVIWLLFVSIAFVYYGFAFSVASITSNPFLLVALGGLIEVPAPVMPIPFVNRWGRRPTIITTYILTGVFALLITITPTSYETLRSFLYLSGKLFVSSAFTVVYLILSEVYPTVVRSTGRGVGALMGRFGSTSAPYVADMLTTVYPDLPSVIFGVVAISVAPIALLLPEMKNVGMKDQVQ